MAASNSWIRSARAVRRSWIIRSTTRSVPGSANSSSSSGATSKRRSSKPLGARFEKRVPVEYVLQELGKLPVGFRETMRTFGALSILNVKTFIVYVPSAWCNPKAMNRNVSLWICEGKDL